MDLFVIVGLGNPGKKYDDTRHNVGFETIDLLSERYGIDVSTKKHQALIGKGMIEGHRVLLVKPQTFMNLSGNSVREIMDFYDVPLEKLIVLCDDVYIKMGSMRIRKGGSHGGHHGIESVINRMGSSDFKRIRIGVGLQPERMDLVDFVLSKFGSLERKLIHEVYKGVADAVVMLMNDGIEKACSRFNGMVIEA